MASTHLSLALCYFNQQQFEIALQHIDLAIASIPNLPDFSEQEFLRMRGLILLQLNRQPEALDLFKALVKRAEVSSSDAAFLAVLEFNTACGATVVFQPVDLFSASELYTVQWNFPKKLKTKNKDYLLQSKEHIETAIRLDETNAMAYYMRGKIKAQLGQDNCCADFLWASKLGYPVELEWMKACAN
jgi:tetratricopeptide (TPR) repeat protein